MYTQVVQVVSLLQVTPPKPCLHFSPATPFSFFLADAKQFLVRSTIMKHLTNVFRFPVNTSLSVPDVFLSILLSSTLRQCSSLSMRDQFLHPYKATRTLNFLHF